MEGFKKYLTDGLNKKDIDDQRTRLTKTLINDIQKKLDAIDNYNSMGKPIKIKSLLVDIERLAKQNKGNF